MSDRSVSLVLPAKRAITVVLGLGLITALSGCSSSAPTEGEASPPPTIQAAVHTVQPQPWPLIVHSHGVLVADEVGAVGTKVAGSVAKVHVELGDVVRAGDPLVELDKDDFQLHVAQAEAQLAQACAAIGIKPDRAIDSLQPESSPPVRQERALWEEAQSSLARAEQLRAQNLIPPAEFDQIAAQERVAEARYAGAVNAAQEKIALIGVRQAELALAREQLQNSVVRAPFDGSVQQRLVAPGDYVQLGDQIVMLVRTDPLRFRGTVPEHHAQRLKVGQQVRLQIEGNDEPRNALVSRISPTLDQASRSLMFEAELANGDQQLRTGLFVEAQVFVDPDAVALVVPRTAVVEFAGAEKVWKLVDGMASEQEVLAGERRAAGVQILSGLEVGDVILLDGSQGSVTRIEPLQSPAVLGTSEEPAEVQTKLAPRPAERAMPVSNVSG